MLGRRVPALEIGRGPVRKTVKWDEKVRIPASRPGHDDRERRRLSDQDCADRLDAAIAHRLGRGGRRKSRSPRDMTPSSCTAPAMS